MPGAPYAYGHGGWYNHPAAPYPPPYPPSNQPPYHAPYVEGASRVPLTMLQLQNDHVGHLNYIPQHAAVTRRPDYYFSGTVPGGYEEPHGDSPPLGRTGTLPNVTVANMAPHALKRQLCVWVAATSDEVHSTQGLLEVWQGSQGLKRLGN